MKVKTSELTGAALDWAVAKCENLEIHPPQKDMKIAVRNVEWEPWWVFTPSTNWEQGGRIIEKGRIHIRPNQSDGNFKAFMIIRPTGLAHRHDGPTPLIAAVRCFVTSKMGDEVEIPEELA
jgi:hypothetical protein